MPYAVWPSYSVMLLQYKYKVSIFTQELKTAFPVSEKKLDKKLKEIERMV